MMFKRRRYLVNTSLQMKITLSFLAATLIGSVTATFAFNYLAMKKLETLMWSTHINVKDTGEIIGPIFFYVNIFDFLLVLVLLIIASMWMLRKTSGPLIRMSKDLMKVADGDLTVVTTLRFKDEFQDTARELNSMISSLRERFEALKEKHQHVSGLVDGLLKETDNPEEVVSNCDRVLESIEGLERELEGFEVEERG